MHSEETPKAEQLTVADERKEQSSGGSTSSDNHRHDQASVATAKGPGPMGIGQVISSVFAAGLGVQSSKNRKRDFQHGRAGTFIAAGLIFTMLFIGTVYTVVSIVLSSR
ncbi:MAG: DUF2970 domain-containing protein [Congregibacter sp.]